MNAGVKAVVVGLAVALAAVALAASHMVGISFVGTTQGIYLLKGGSKPLEIRNDLYLDDEKRLIAAVPFEPLAHWIRSIRSRDPALPFLRVEWDAKEGEGFVIQEMAGGKQLVANFSRFRDDTGLSTAGIFLGGSLPFAANRQAAASQNVSGMAYFDGNRWLHVWCSANEAVGSARAGAAQLQPSGWEYLWSAVLASTPQEVVIADSHRVHIDGVPVRIDKQVRFRAGESFFTLVTRFTNEGSFATRYRYEYGDEPWVGHYGTSLGDVGWTRVGLMETEGAVDTTTTDFIGMYDFGNPRIGEPHRYTGMAGFLEWDARSTPDLAFFANQGGSLGNPDARPPLRSLVSRFLGLEWGPRNLAPGETGTFTVAVGMAQGSQTPPYLPVKPRVRFF